MRRPGRVLSRFELLEHAWDYEYEHRSNVIDVYVRYLREKIDRPFEPRVARDGARGGVPAASRRRHMSRIPLRLRLTLAFAVIMAALLGAIGAYLYIRLQNTLDEQLEQNLAARADDVAALVGGPTRRSARATASPRATRASPR